MAMRNVTRRAIGMVTGPDGKAYAGVARGDGPEIGAPEQERQIAQDKVDAEGT